MHDAFPFLSASRAKLLRSLHVPSVYETNACCKLVRKVQHRRQTRNEHRSHCAESSSNASLRSGRYESARRAYSRRHCARVAASNRADDARRSRERPVRIPRVEPAAVDAHGRDLEVGGVKVRGIGDILSAGAGAADGRKYTRLTSPCEREEENVRSMRYYRMGIKSDNAQSPQRAMLMVICCGAKNWLILQPLEA